MQAIIIDDDMPTVDVILSSMDFGKFNIDKVHSAYNIETARKLFEENDIDIAICDIEMPKGSGLDLIKWAREKNYDTEFIFLTSHEKFDYARTAIEYSASGYVVKPFNPDRMEAEITTALQRIHERNKSRKADSLEEWYEGNLEYVESGFWRDVLHQRIQSDRDTIRREIEHRRLDVDADGTYRLFLFSGGTTDLIEESMGKDGVGTYEKEVVAFFLERTEGGPGTGRFAAFHDKNIVYIAMVADDGAEYGVAGDEESDGVCRELFSQKMLEEAREKFGIAVTLYISNPCSIEELYRARIHMEELDKNNVASKGRIFNENDEIVMASSEGHVLDQEQVRLLLGEKKKKELLNLLKFSMESLAAQKKLDAAALTEMKQDLLQAVYVYLYGKEIQATRLFADDAFATLERQATDSMVNMVRWQVYMITKTIDYVSEVEQSDSIVSKAKSFVAAHYKEDISRVEIAESVYLTPEYMAKLFKKETGISIKQYITDFRIAKAKELLSAPGARVSDVATEVGFDNFSYFSTVFKKATGLSPNEYNKS